MEFLREAPQGSKASKQEEEDPTNFPVRPYPLSLSLEWKVEGRVNIQECTSQALVEQDLSLLQTGHLRFSTQKIWEGDNR